MILNTGSRTDIPAFYSEWFMNRIRAGEVMARNPYYYHQISRYRLDPQVVDIIVFCTKNPEPMLKYLEELKRFRMFWFVTITPYGKDIEPNLPDKNRVMESFRKLSMSVGSKAVGWRYDPILINEKYTRDYHVDIFAKMAERLQGYTDKVTISFIDLYGKTRRSFPQAKEVSVEDQAYLCEKFVKIARQYGMRIYLCHEDEQLGRFGAITTGCMSREVLEEACDVKLKVKRSLNTREGCSCLLGNDIGQYNTCLHMCRYCYANDQAEKITANYQKHDPASPLLIGQVEENDVIKDSPQISFLDDMPGFSL